MKRTLPLIVTLIFPAALTAQTYFYIYSMQVSPPSPTTVDDITLTVSGDLSSTAVSIEETEFEISGTNVLLGFNAVSQGIGLAVLVPHEETFQLGQLAAGTYTISVVGDAQTDDNAPAPEHTFVVSGTTRIADGAHGSQVMVYDGTRPLFNEPLLGTSQMQSAEVYSVSGAQVLTVVPTAAGSMNVNVGALPNGVYVLHMRTGHGTVARTFSLQR
jgi:hypothetical protein